VRDLQPACRHLVPAGPRTGGLRLSGLGLYMNWTTRIAEGYGVNILVVEDELAVAEMIQQALEQLGNSCVIARDADDADRVLAATDVEAVTLDLGMPGRGGLAWLESVARTRPELARKTLVITGMYLEPECVGRLARCGAGILAKPFTMEHLADAVRTQLEARIHEQPRSN